MADAFDFYVYDNRSIVHTSPEPIMQEDKDVAVWRFRIPKVLNNIDMSAWAWWFVYVNAKNQKFSELLTLTNDIDDPENYCTADYSIGYGISRTPGGFTFALEAINTSQDGEISGEWHTRTYTHTVTPTLQGNQAEYTETESDIISALIQQIQQKYNALVGGATPLPVNLKSLMADPQKVYLYTGSETGESTGYWYYWNGTDFVPGGVYGAGVQIDSTLSQSGQAADAKETGDKIEETTGFLRDTNADVYEASALTVNATVNEWKLNASNGLSVSDSNYKIVKYMVTAGDRIKVIANDKFQFQTIASVPSYGNGNSNRVGKTYSAGTYYLTVPETATYLIMSALASDGIAEAYSLATKTDGLAEQIENTDVEVANIKDTLQVEKIEPVNKIDPSIVMDGRYIYNGTYQNNTSYKTTDYIPVNAGDVIAFYRKTSVVPNVERTTGERLALFDASKNYLGVSEQFPVKINTYYTVENVSAKYIRLSYPASLGDVELTVNQTIDEYSEYFSPRFESLRLIKIEQGTDVITLNKNAKSLLLQAKRPKNMSLDAYLREPKPLALLHFSDIHGDSVELERIVEFSESNSDLIDDSICTGDLVVGRWSSDFSYWSNTAGAEKILIAIGNHDVLTDEVGQDWTQRATQSDQYTRYFAPFIENWNCSYESGKTYYYKDYDDSKIRLIVLNCMLTGADDTAQLAWFVSTLSGAKTAGYSVVVANHYMVSSPVKVSCNFSTLDKSVEGVDVLPSAYLAEVQNHIDDGGKFICHIAGHTHWDVVVKSQNYPNQICIVVDALNRTQSNQYSDTQRTNGDKSQDLANVVVFDTSSGVVKVIRIGASADHYLRQKNCLTIDYLTGSIITES